MPYTKPHYEHVSVYMKPHYEYESSYVKPHFEDLKTAYRQKIPARENKIPVSKLEKPKTPHSGDGYGEVRGTGGIGSRGMMTYN